MAKTLKEELEDIAGPGMTDMRRVGKWLEMLTMHVVALETQRDQDRNELMSHAGRLAALETRTVAPTQEVADLPDHLRELSDAYRAENKELRAEVSALKDRPAPQWPTPQPIETAPCETVILAYDAEYKVWEKMYTRRTSPAVRAKKRYPVWLPMPPPPGGGK